MAFKILAQFSLKQYIASRYSKTMASMDINCNFIQLEWKPWFQNHAAKLGPKVLQQIDLGKF